MQLPKEDDGMLAHIGMWFLIICVLTPVAWIIALLGGLLRFLREAGLGSEFLEECLEDSADWMLSKISK